MRRRAKSRSTHASIQTQINRRTSSWTHKWRLQTGAKTACSPFWPSPWFWSQPITCSWWPRWSDNSGVNRRLLSPYFKTRATIQFRTQTRLEPGRCVNLHLKVTFVYWSNSAELPAVTSKALTNSDVLLCYRTGILFNHEAIWPGESWRTRREPSSEPRFHFITFINLSIIFLDNY